MGYVIPLMTLRDTARSMERSSGYTAIKKCFDDLDIYTVRELLMEMETLTQIRFLRKVWSDAHRGYQAPEIGHGVLRD